ncbi:ribosome maturation factor RimP [Brachybacterium sacelli]|uniref:Ribosome maturation factor RimP n=1 Tax=Brachybacterium sacelli TaxID=173364 RepID=A0ABS4X173_9MICO|nr:ribosome assembly cofactor RimP [Brachybacterium sacelli]MBP2382143.1 ribosome maturation factor RimP [Brachybacterium sacelli]
MSDLDGPEDHTALREAAAGILAPHDLVLEEIVVAGPRTRPEVRLIVDLPEDRLGSADLDTVTTASRELGALIDADDSLLGPDPVVFEVTTPGVERELTAARHFRRSRGRLLTLRVAEGTQYRARLLGVTAGDVLLLRQEPGRDDRGRPRRLPAGTAEHLEIPRAEVDSARVEIEFDPPDDLAQLIADADHTASKES